MSDSADNTPAQDPSTEPAVVLQTPLPEHLTQADPGLLVDSVRGSAGGAPGRSDTPARSTENGS